MGSILDAIPGRKSRKFGNTLLIWGGIVQNCRVIVTATADRIRVEAVSVMPKGRGICLDPTNHVQSLSDRWIRAELLPQIEVR